jgi:hypothetical protein
MSHFELQPATPSVKEIIDAIEEEFFLLLANCESGTSIRLMFQKAKQAAMLKLLKGNHF